MVLNGVLVAELKITYLFIMLCLAITVTSVQHVRTNPRFILAFKKARVHSEMFRVLCLVKNILKKIRISD
jgi:hypothetical protein